MHNNTWLDLMEFESNGNYTKVFIKTDDPNKVWNWLQAPEREPLSRLHYRIKSDNRKLETSLDIHTIGIGFILG